MKILMVDQIAKVNYKYTYSLASAIAQQENEVILAVDQKTETEGCNCRKLNLFNTDDKNIGKLTKLINYFASYVKIYQELLKGNYDVLHTQWLIFSPVDYFFLRKIKKKCRVKLIVTIHDILPFNQKFYDLCFHRKVYKLADQLIVQAENNIKRFDELFPEMSGKETMIPHGHFLDYAEPIDKVAARNYLKLPVDKTIFLFFGQIKKVKGVGLLLEAFQKIREKNPEALLVIAGSVWKDDFTQYQEIIDRYHMQAAVRTEIRYIPDEEIKYYYSAADCCVLPYLDVYQSGVVQLTYAYKKPVVATRIGAFREVVLENKSGFMCEPNNIDSLAEAIGQALEKAGRFEAMGEEGYNYIKDKFSWDKIARKVCELYESGCA